MTVHATLPRYSLPDGWAVDFDGVGYLVRAPRDGVCGWAETRDQALAKVNALRAEGVWR